MSSLYYINFHKIVLDVIRKKHYSIRTEHAYFEWVKGFVIFHKGHEKDLGEK